MVCPAIWQGVSLLTLGRLARLFNHIPFWEYTYDCIWMAQVVICGSVIFSCNEASSELMESATLALEKEGVDEAGSLPSGQEAAQPSLGTNQAMRTLNALYAYGSSTIEWRSKDSE